MLARSIWKGQGERVDQQVEVEADLSMDGLDRLPIPQEDMSWADDSAEQLKTSPSLTRGNVEFPRRASIADFFSSSSRTKAHGKSDSHSSDVSSTTAQSEDSSLAEAAKTSLTLPSDTTSSSSQDGQTTPLAENSASWNTARKEMKSNQDWKIRRGQTRAISAPSSPPTRRKILMGGQDDADSLPASNPKASDETALQPIPMQTSFSSRNLASLRNLAASWVPGRSEAPTPRPSHSSQNPITDPQQLIPFPKESDKQMMVLPGSHPHHGPVRLDRRRLDKAVSLAVEAAQAAEEDERIHRVKERRRRARAEERRRRASVIERERQRQSGLLGRIRNLSEYSALSDGEGGSKFGSLPWRRRGTVVAPTSPRKSSSQRSRTTPNSPQRSDDEEFAHDEQDICEADTNDDDACEEEEEEEDNFSLSLYLSSLSYLLSALPSKEAVHLPEKEREQLRSKLHEALRDLGSDEQLNSQLERSGHDSALNNEAVREERLRELLETELRRAEARMTGGGGGLHGRSSSMNVHSRRASSRRQTSEQSSTSSSMASAVAYSALELTFTFAAAGIGLVGSGISRLVPSASTQNRTEGAGSTSPYSEAKIIGEVCEDEKALQRREDPSSPLEQGSRNASLPAGTQRRRGDRNGTTGSGLQWDLAMALASSTASTLYGCLSSAADEAVRQDAALNRARQRERSSSGKGSSEVALASDASALVSVTEEDLNNMPEDQLILLSASFARALKRSPLPSQLATLSSQLLSLLHSLDERYSLSKRATDEALKRTRQGLGYARRRGWHVKVVRAAWALVEMSVAGVEAWREEEQVGVDVAAGGGGGGGQVKGVDGAQKINNGTGRAATSSSEK